MKTEWTNLVKSLKIDLIPKSERGFICRALFGAQYQIKNRGTLSSVLEKQEGK